MNKKSAFMIMIASFIFALLLVPSANIFAAQLSNAVVYENNDTGFDAILIDQANLLTDGEEKQLASEMEKITQFCTAVFVSSNEAYTGSVKNHARKIMERICGSMNLNGYTATIFLIDMYDRQICIYSGETVFSIITTGIADSITDNTYTYASRQDYYGCASEAFSQIYRVLDGQKIAQPMRYITAALLAIFAGLSVALLFIRAKTKKIYSGKHAQVDTLLIDDCNPVINVRLISTKKIKHIESSGGGGGGSSGGFSGGGGGFSGGGGGGFSGGGGGGSHSF